MPTSVPNPASPFLKKCLESISCATTGIALDLPCGSGRNIPPLIAKGFEVVAADIEQSMLVLAGNVAPCTKVQLDARKPLPFKESAFDIAIVIHPVDHTVLKSIGDFIRPSGYIVYETFGAHGMNSRSLPFRGEVSAILGDFFDFVIYKEVPTRREPDKVTVKALFRRR